MAFPLARERTAAERRSAPAPVRLHVRPRRRPRLLAGSAVLLVSCTALFVTTYVKAGRQVPVLAVGHAVPQGAVISSGDLQVVRISASGPVDPVPAGEAGRVVGRRAAVALVPGSLLTMNELSSGPGIPPGDAIVGVSVKASQLPADGLTSGQQVEVVLTGIPGTPVFSTASSASTSVPPSAAPQGVIATSGSPPVLAGGVIVPRAVVTASFPGTSANSDTTDVSLLVPSTVAALVASASAAGQVALVAMGDGG